MSKQHREYLEWLEENDPIAYAERQGDPVTGLRDDGSGEAIGCAFFFIFMVIAFLIGGIFVYLYLN